MDPVDAPSVDFVGRGLAFPLRVDHTGALATVDGAESIETAIRVVLATAPGERVMRSEFGCRVWQLLFEPVNAATLGLMAQAVYEALEQWEPRADIEDVDVAPDPHDAQLVRIHITYRVKATNDRRNLVHPFYVIPQEDDDGAPRT